MREEDKGQQKLTKIIKQKEETKDWKKTPKNKDFKKETYLHRNNEQQTESC